MTSLTPAQLTTLKVFIQANYPTSNDEQIRDSLNQTAMPAFIGWRGEKTKPTVEELRDAIFIGGTQLDALTASKRDSLLWSVEHPIDFSVPSNRAAIDDFCGSQNTLKAALQAVQKRSATVGEKVLATGTGTTVSPATFGYEGPFTSQDVVDALNS